MQDKNARMGNAGPENVGLKMQDQKMRDLEYKKLVPHLRMRSSSTCECLDGAINIKDTQESHWQSPVHKLSVIVCIMMK